MSLVDYASSDDEEKEDDKNEPPQVPKDESTPTTPSPPPQRQHQRAELNSNQITQSVSRSSAPPIERLPDASLLLNSLELPSHLASASDHSSRVAAAMAESASRKREANGSASSLPRSKVPRGSLPPSRNTPDTVGGMLVPPQLHGRSVHQQTKVFSSFCLFMTELSITGHEKLVLEKSNVVTEDISKLFVRRQSAP